jgi:iron complex outermembrane recepter protein
MTQQSIENELDASFARHLRVLALLASAAATVAAAPAFAQAGGQSAPPSAATPNPSADVPTQGLEEVMVTATRRSERLQDVPVSVTAISQEAMARQNVGDLDDLPKLVPGLTLNYGTQPGNFSINLRGIGTLANGIAVESDVAVVIDDVPLGYQAEAFKDLVDVERIEVLNGPQSTLFGKSAIAGVLNIVTQAPTDDWTGHFTSLVTDDHEWRVGGTVAGPLTDTLKFRLTAAQDSWDGNVSNLTTGDHLNGSKGRTVTGKLLWEPTDRFSLTFQPRYNHTDMDCCVNPIVSLSPGLFYQGAPQLPESAVLAGIPTNNPNNTLVRNDFRAGGDAESEGGTVHAGYRLDGGPLPEATVMYIGSYDNYQMHDYQDVDGTASPFLLYYPLAAPAGIDSGTVLRGSFRVDSTTQELRLTSPSGPFRYVFGLWYARNSLARDLNRGPVLQEIHYIATTANDTYSFYDDLAWDVVEKLTLVGGFRLNRQTIDYTYDDLTAVPPFHLAGDTAENAITGKAGLEYHVTPDNMLYSTFSTGYKGQAYDLSSAFNATVAAHSPIPSEKAHNYEIGSKNDFFDRRLIVNGTLFWTDYYGFQATSITVLPDGFPLAALQSVGHLRTRGLEANFTAKPVQQFSINGSGAFTDAKILDFPTGSCYSGQATVLLPTNQSVPAPGQCGIRPATGPVQNLAGGRLDNAPQFKFNIGGQYDLPLNNGYGAFAGLDYRWQSDVNFSLNQDPLTVQRAYGIFDASVGATAEDGRYKVTLFTNNVFNKHYAVNLTDTASGFSAPGVTALGETWQPARDAFRYVGLRFDVNFR